MTLRKAALLPPREVERILYLRLGARRGWSDWLGDIRRGEGQPFLGLTLLPYGRGHDGRCARPLYLASDVRAFIEQAKALDPTITGKEPIEAVRVEIDPADRRSWRVRDLTSVS
jgi:hypothetical protein